MHVSNGGAVGVLLEDGRADVTPANCWGVSPLRALVESKEDTYFTPPAVELVIVFPEVRVDFSLERLKHQFRDFMVSVRTVDRLGTSGEVPTREAHRGIVTRARRVWLGKGTRGEVTDEDRSRIEDGAGQGDAIAVAVSHVMKLTPVWTLLEADRSHAGHGALQPLRLGLRRLLAEYVV